MKHGGIPNTNTIIVGNNSSDSAVFPRSINFYNIGSNTATLYFFVRPAGEALTLRHEMFRFSVDAGDRVAVDPNYPIDLIITGDQIVVRGSSNYVFNYHIFGLRY